MEKICCFFGHGDTDSDIFKILYSEIEKHITQFNIATFYVGGYGSFDRMSVVILNEIKRKYPYINIVHVLAYLPIEKTNEYKTSLYSSTIYPNGLEIVPQKFAITYRNRWIVEQSDCLITYVRTSYGGAYKALQYAKRKGKKIVNLYKR